ncbi:MAG: enoyl-CoA hydratase/isomerase family protein [Planctomycetaceae bacterium]
MCEADAVLLEERQGNVWLTLNRPEALNAINEPMLLGLLRCLDQIGDSGRPLILTGAGRAFCAGGDLKGYLAKLDDPQAMRDYFDIVTRLFCRLADYPGVTIAAVNGVAVAGGLELVCACDLAVAADSARLADGHINYGLHPGGGASGLLSKIVGERRARWLLLSGEFITATEAERIGLVNRIVPANELETAANAMGASVGRHSRSAMRRTKALLRTELAEALKAEHASLLEHFQDPETRRQLERFAAQSKEKRNR